MVLAPTTGLFTLMRDSWRPQYSERFYVALCEKCAKQEIPRGHWCIHKLLQAQICWILHFTISFLPAKGTCRSSLTLLRDWILGWKNFISLLRDVGYFYILGKDSCFTSEISGHVIFVEFLITDGLRKLFTKRSST